MHIRMILAQLQAGLEIKMERAQQSKHVVNFHLLNTKTCQRWVFFFSSLALVMASHVSCKNMEKLFRDQRERTLSKSGRYLWL